MNKKATTGLGTCKMGNGNVSSTNSTKVGKNVPKNQYDKFDNSFISTMNNYSNIQHTLNTQSNIEKSPAKGVKSKNMIGKQMEIKSNIKNISGKRQLTPTRQTYKMPDNRQLTPSGRMNKKRESNISNDFNTSDIGRMNTNTNLNHNYAHNQNLTKTPTKSNKYKKYGCINMNLGMAKTNNCNLSNNGHSSNTDRVHVDKYNSSSTNNKGFSYTGLDMNCLTEENKQTKKETKEYYNEGYLYAPLHTNTITHSNSNYNPKFKK